jgi:hypothetical protein
MLVNFLLDTSLSKLMNDFLIIPVCPTIEIMFLQVFVVSARFLISFSRTEIVCASYKKVDNYKKYFNK